MRRAKWLLHLWPGLSPLWKWGSWPTLSLAAGFAVLLNLALLANLAWTEWPPASARWLSRVALFVYWGIGLPLSWWMEARRNAVIAVDAGEDLFPQAMDEYLQGNWHQVEKLCHSLLRKNPGDADARLLLATALRRTQRPADAWRQLDELDRFDSAATWIPEVREERRLLTALLSAPPELGQGQMDHQANEVEAMKAA